MNVDNDVAIAVAGGIPVLVSVARDGSIVGKENAAAALKNLAFENVDNKVDDVLENLVAEYFDVLVKVLQFIGQWLYLNTIDQTSMPSVKMTQGQNLQLGTNAIVGSRVWDVQGRFRLRIGPLNYDRFLNLIPPDRDPQIICAPPVGGDSPVLAQMTRLYAGEQFDSDVQLILDRNEVPECGLGATGPKLEIASST